MTLDDLRPGWRTDFILHRFDAQVLERPDSLVVRTPANPTYYWGNCLVLPRLPGDDELAHWLQRFHDEIGGPQPASRHVAIGIDAEWQGQQRPAWEAAGFQLVVNHALVLRPDALGAPARAPHGAVQFRPLDLQTESEALIEVEITDAGVFEPVGYRAYLRSQHARYRAMQAAGLLQWFGVFCDGHLAATCGLMRGAAVPRAEARFQRVVTHAQWRRRGLATALVHGVCDWARTHWQPGAFYMVADPDDVAIGIYRSLGFADLSSGMGLQRNAPQDGGPA